MKLSDERKAMLMMLESKLKNRTKFNAWELTANSAILVLLDDFDFTPSQLQMFSEKLHDRMCEQLKIDSGSTSNS